MIDSLTAPSGLETALGAALGEELTSALDPEADRHWRELPPLVAAPSLPATATSLLEMVEARQPSLDRCRRSLWSRMSRSHSLPGRSGSRPDAGIPRGGDLALGWLYDSGGNADPGGGAAAATQPPECLGEALTAAEQASERANAAQTESEQLARTAALSEQLALTVIPN